MNAGRKPMGVLLLVGLLVISITACGGGDGSSGGTSASSSNVEGTVTVWDFEYESFPEYAKAVDQLNAEFEREHPGVTVNWVAQPYSGYEATYRAAFAAREGPDVMAMQTGAAGILSFAKGLEVINDHLAPDLSDHILKAGWESVTAELLTDGERYGVPIGLNGNVFYYNKKMFKRAGLPTEFQPESWVEVREAGEALKEAGLQPFTGGNKEGLENSFWWSQGFQTQNPPEATSELLNGEIAYTDPAFAQGFDPLIEMVDAGLFSKEWFSTPWIPEGYASFGNENGAMILGWWSQVGYWGEFNPTIGEENVGMFLPPGGSQVGVNGSFALSVPTFARNKDAAWALLNFYGSMHANEVLYKVAGNLPIRDDVPLSENAPEQAVQLVEWSRERETSIGALGAIPSNITFVTLPTEINRVLRGQAEMTEALDAMQEAYERSDSK